MFVTSYSVTYCIYIPENREFVFISIAQIMMSANSRIRFGLQIVFVCLYITPSHYHHCANFIRRHWTRKMPVRYNLSRVWVRLSIFSQLSIIQYMGLCVFSLPISFVMIERIYIYTLSYYHHQIGSMDYYPLFRVMAWNNGMRCMSFYILMGPSWVLPAPEGPQIGPMNLAMMLIMSQLGISYCLAPHTWQTTVISYENESSRDENKLPRKMCESNNRCKKNYQLIFNQLITFYGLIMGMRVQNITLPSEWLQGTAWNKVVYNVFWDASIRNITAWNKFILIRGNKLRHGLHWNSYW